MPRAKDKTKSPNKETNNSKEKETKGKKRKRSNDDKEDEKETKKRKSNWLRDIKAILRSSGSKLVFPENFRQKKIKKRKEEHFNFPTNTESQCTLDEPGCSKFTYQASDSIGAIIQLEKQTYSIGKVSSYSKIGEDISSLNDDEIETLRRSELDHCCMDVSENNDKETTDKDELHTSSLNESVAKPDSSQSKIIDSKALFEAVKITIRQNDKNLISDIDDYLQDDSSHEHHSGIVIDAEIPHQISLDVNSAEEIKFIEETNSMLTNDTRVGINQCLNDCTQLNNTSTQEEGITSYLNTDNTNHSSPQSTENHLNVDNSRDVNNNESIFYFGNHNGTTDRIMFNSEQDQTESEITNGTNMDGRDISYEQDLNDQSLINDSNKFWSHQNSIYIENLKHNSPKYMPCCDEMSAYGRCMNHGDSSYENDYTSSLNTNLESAAYYDSRNAFLDAAAIQENRPNSALSLKNTWGSIKNLLSKVSGQGNGGGTSKDCETDINLPDQEFGT